MNNTQTKSASEFIEESYLNYGRYVNNYRHIPWALDGLKPSYRRVILSVLQYKGFTKTVTVAANTVMLYHPHGESINQVPGSLVRAGIFDGQGNFGAKSILGDDVDEAAARYTEVKIKDQYRKFFEALLPYVPKKINEFGHEEAEYLPTPIPLIMTFGGLGIGIGTGFKSTAFTPKSLYEAYIHDDPNLLENAYGNEILKSQSKLKELWEHGTGGVKIKLKTRRDWSDGIEGTIIEGDVTEFRPNFQALESFREQGRVSMKNLSDSVQRLKFSKMPRVWTPSNDEIEEMVSAASIGSVVNLLRVNYKETVYEIGLRDWIDLTYKNYMNLLDIRNNDKIQKAQRQIILYTHFRNIADRLINSKDSYEDISSSIGVDLDIVKEVGSKSINTLRNLDPLSKVDSLKDEIKFYQNFDKAKYVESVIAEF